METLTETERKRDQRKRNGNVQRASPHMIMTYRSLLFISMHFCSYDHDIDSVPEDARHAGAIRPPLSGPPPTRRSPGCSRRPARASARARVAEEQENEPCGSRKLRAENPSGNAENLRKRCGKEEEKGKLGSGAWGSGSPLNGADWVLKVLLLAAGRCDIVLHQAFRAIYVRTTGICGEV
jgi:hypothetical protein